MLTVLALLAGLAACGDEPGSSSKDGSGGQASADPSGTTYVVTGITESGKPRPPVEGSQIRFEFAEDRLVITAGCNTMSGGYTYDGGTLTVDTLAMTQMACPTALMEQDSWLAGLFEQPVEMAISGDDATITAGEVELTLKDREAVAPDDALEGTRWELDSIADGSTVSSIPAGVTAWIELADGQVQLNDGCNNGHGPAVVSGSRITFGPLAGTRMACPESEDVQRAFATVLDGVTTYELDQGTLWIRKGDQGLAFRTGSAG
ncbi:META domain-containing protein [Marmoricola sp. RAF53]|uniref:META domain-containing protein n=1 Tax=Marmoricola sp. RAF53 TaxID=3233059 RepID=UPI003F9C1C68